MVFSKKQHKSLNVLLFLYICVMAYKPSEIEDLFNKILIKISIDGMAIRNVLKEKGMPGSETFFKWLDEDEIKAKRYARACEVRADIIFDEMLAIADDGTNDYMTKLIGESEVDVLNTENVQRSRLRIDTRKFMVAKLNPKKYGDKIDVTSGDKPIQPLEFKLIK